MSKKLVQSKAKLQSLTDQDTTDYIWEKYGIKELTKQLANALAKCDAELAATIGARVDWEVSTRVISKREAGHLYPAGSAFDQSFGRTKALPSQVYIKDVTPKDTHK